MKKIYKLSMSLVLLFIAVHWGQAQTMKVTGTVTEKLTGNPVAGVNILIKGTSLGTITDANGMYTIEAKKGETLVFSFIGFLAEEVLVNNEVINVGLTEDITNLEEIVISGLATSVKRSNLANSVASISAKDLAGMTQQSTMDGAMYGKFKGANITANSGAPGGGISIKLRGITSLGGNNEPLYIIDGVYLDNSAVSPGLNIVSRASGGGNQSNQDNPSNRIADIDPEDIETIEILKGASAAAIYGSRAAGGVVIITTKKGKEGKTSINISQSIGFTEMLNPLGQRSWDETKVATHFGADEVPIFQQAKNAGLIHNYEDALYGNKGLVATTRISANGGSDKTTFFVGVTRKDDEGIVKNTGYEKTSFRLNIGHEISEYVKVDLSSNYIESSADRGFFNNDNSGTTMGISYVATPSWAQLFPDENGIYPNNPYAGSNFLQTAALITNNESIKRIITGINFTAKLYQSDNMSLKLISRGGIDSYHLNTTALFPNTLQFQAIGNPNGTEGASIQGFTGNRNTNMAFFLVHDLFPGGGDLSFRTQFGVTAENFNQNNIIGFGTYLIGSQTNIDQAGSRTVNQDRLIQKDRGFFAQEEINYGDKIIGTIGLRGDKSSNNGDPNKMYFYPKGSIALNIHEFSFWNISLINQFKIRSAYGEAGNFAAFGSTYNPMTAVNIDGSAGLILGNTRGDKSIGPERQKEFEAGFDISAISNTVTLDFTYYNQTVENLILAAETSPSSGQVNVVTNAAELQNRGIEIGLNLHLLQNTTIKWNSRTNFWKNTGEVTKLAIPTFTTGGFADFLGQFRIKEGHSPTEIIGVGPNPDEDGLQVFGDAEPDFQMSFMNNLTYKNFDLSFLWHWKKGGENINLSALLSDLSGTSYDYDIIDLDPEGLMGNGDYRLSQLGANTGPYIEDAGYVRLREVGLYYSFPQSLNFNFISNIKIGVSGQNLINIFDYRSYDPEVSNFGSKGLSTGVEVTPFPSSKRYNFHIMLKL